MPERDPVWTEMVREYQQKGLDLDDARDEATGARRQRAVLRADSYINGLTRAHEAEIAELREGNRRMWTALETTRKMLLATTDYVEEVRRTRRSDRPKGRGRPLLLETGDM